MAHVYALSLPLYCPSISSDGIIAEPKRCIKAMNRAAKCISHSELHDPGSELGGATHETENGLIGSHISLGVRMRQPIIRMLAE